MLSFEFATTKRIINEIGGLSSIAIYCRELGIKRPFIVSDTGIAKLGILDELSQYLRTAGLSPQVFDQTLPDPPESIIHAASKLAIELQSDGVIGIGGGSSMDCAKLVAVLLKQEQTLQDLYGVDNISSARAPLLLLPTTAGTGSEVTPISIVTTGETTKAGVVSSVLLPDIALLDASLSLDLPNNITAATGIDAMVHALEAFTSKIKKNPYSDMLALQALRLLSANIDTAVHYGKNVNARQNMMLGACLAGQAFANAPVGAVHALAYPLGGHFHIPHGLSNSLVLPHVMRFNSSHASGLYAQAAEAVLPPPILGATKLQQCENLINYFSSLPVNFDLPTKLSSVGVNSDHLAMLANDAIKQERLLINNPKDLNYEDALRIYEKAY